MSATKVYTCDICREKIKKPEESYGLNFTGLLRFKIDNYLTTEGAHICFGCARQLKEQLALIAIPEEGGTPDAKEYMR